MLTILILQVNLINVLISGMEMNRNNCTFSTDNKPSGYFDLDSGIASVDSFYEFNIENKEMCNRKCQYNDNCYATSYYRQKCKFLNSTDFIIHPNGNIQYSKWTTCNTSEGSQPPDNRCLGLWITYSDKYIEVEQYEPFKNISTDYLNCRNKCLKNPLCGFVNRFDKQCILVAKYPYQNINITDRIDWEMDKWVCVDNFVNTFQPKNQSKKPIDEKCSGHWEITNRNTILTLNQSEGLSFQTQIYENCLEECNQYPNCKTAWYNFTYSLCILKDVEISEFHLIHNDTTFINFEWKCEENDSHMPLLNTDEIKYLNLGMSCYKIVNATNLFIGRDKCGQCPHESEFHKCSLENYNSWDIRDSCLEKQSYWSFQPTQISMNISGQLVRNLIKVFTGLQLYWIAFPDNHIKKFDYLECRHFNVTRPLEMLQNNEIISKEEWYSQPPQGHLRRFQSTPINIVITASQQPFYSCRTKPACIDILRTLQVKYFHGIGDTHKYSDIPYNFMIDDSGHIYEGRGLKHECAAVYPHNENTICLGYIGWYDKKLPNEAYLSGIKKLIDYLEKHQYVVKDYTVYIHQDLTKVQIKRNLKIVIKNFYRYKDFLPEDCRSISFLLVIINFSVILIIFLTYFLYRFFNFKSACKRCKFLNYEDILIFQIFPLNSDDPVHLVNTKLNGDTQNLIYEKHVSASNVFKSIKLIKLWFFNKTLEAINSRFSHNNLQNYLSNMLRKETGISIYQFDSKNWSNIIIVSNSYRINLLKQLIFNGKCICFYFTIEHIDFSDFPTDIQIVK